MKTILEKVISMINEFWLSVYIGYIQMYVLVFAREKNCTNTLDPNKKKIRIQTIFRLYSCSYIILSYYRCYTMDGGRTSSPESTSPTPTL